ncbi:MAG: hypothetical protein A2V70_19475 [Planctomycetes bacterium RBG_13_63_9]|nr:MAG: hypothetical protein A2V70_19475 [Planctomycetes bacterium RBG_13_63_9]
MSTITHAFPGSRGAAIDYLQKEFGGNLDFNNFDLVVDLALVQVLPFNPERIMFTLMNLGPTVITVSPDQRTSALHGLRLGPNGGFLSFNVRDDGIIPTLEWTAVGDLAGGSLYVLNTFRDVLS